MYLFLLVTVLNLIPVLSFRYFPTLDGPAHLHNARLISSLLFDDSAVLTSFFRFTPEPVPNWTGHVLLSFFGLFLPAFLAEKALLLLYLIGLPLSFRALVRTITPAHSLLSFLIFPFVFSFLFYLGFYNFSIALVFMFLTLNYWIKNESSFRSPRRLLVLFVLLSLTYFSHIFVFGLLLFLIFLHTTTSALAKIIEDWTALKAVFRSSLQKAGVLLLASFVPLVLFFFYFSIRSHGGQSVFLERTELLEWIKSARPIIVFDLVWEGSFSKKVFYVLSAFGLIAFYGRVNEIWDAKKLTLRGILKPGDAWLLAAGAILLFYFVLPDSDDAAGYVSMRLLLLFFMFLILWLSTYRFRPWFSILMITVVLYGNFRLNQFYFAQVAEMSAIARDCERATEFIPAYSVVLPINLSDEWMHLHFSNYLGIDKPMVILENYECAMGYFPLKWNDEAMPNTLFGDVNASGLGCLDWRSNIQNPSLPIEFVFVLGPEERDYCSSEISDLIIEFYEPVFQTENCRLFKQKML